MRVFDSSMRMCTHYTTSPKRIPKYERYVRQKSKDVFKTLYDTLKPNGEPQVLGERLSEESGETPLSPLGGKKTTKNQFSQPNARRGSLPFYPRLAPTRVLIKVQTPSRTKKFCVGYFTSLTSPTNVSAHINLYTRFTLADVYKHENTKNYHNFY